MKFYGISIEHYCIPVFDINAIRFDWFCSKWRINRGIRWSGVINDISKIVSNISCKKYIIVATAPSMDGYASATSSMTMEGLKIGMPKTVKDIGIDEKT